VRAQVAATVLMAALLMGCANTAPDPDEEGYLAELAVAGIVTSAEDMLAAGWYACDRFEDGESLSDVASDAIARGMTTGDALVIATAAAVHLCPEYGNLE
jgi:hypothetical protein